MGSLVDELNKNKFISFCDKHVIFKATQQELGKLKITPENVRKQFRRAKEKYERKAVAEGSKQEDRGTGTLQQDVEGNGGQSLQGFRCHFLRR